MDLDFTPVIDSAQFLIGGLGLTLALSALTILFSLALGGAIGLARCYGPGWLRVPLVFKASYDKANRTSGSSFRSIGLDASQAIDEQRPLQEFGLDSLMAVELRNGLAAEAQCTLPATFVFDYPVAGAITDFLLTTLQPAATGEIPVLTAAPSASAPSASSNADVAAMSDEDATALLMEELAELRSNG